MEISADGINAIFQMHRREISSFMGHWFQFFARPISKIQSLHLFDESWLRSGHYYTQNRNKYFLECVPVAIHAAKNVEIFACLNDRMPAAIARETGDLKTIVPQVAEFRNREAIIAFVRIGANDQQSGSSQAEARFRGIVISVQMHFYQFIE